MAHGSRVSALHDKGVLGRDGGDGYTALRMHFPPLNCTPASGYGGDVMLCVLYNNKNNFFEETNIRMGAQGGKFKMIPYVNF